MFFRQPVSHANVQGVEVPLKFSLNAADDATDKDRQIFLKHILQAKKVAQYQHPNLVCLVGCVTEMEPLSLLTECPEQGDLLTYLRSQRMEVNDSLSLHLPHHVCSCVSSPSCFFPFTIPCFSWSQIYQSKLQMLDYQNGACGHKLPNTLPQYNSEQSLQPQDLMLFASHVAAGLVREAIYIIRAFTACIMYTSPYNHQQL